MSKLASIEFASFIFIFLDVLEGAGKYHKKGQDTFNTFNISFRLYVSYKLKSSMSIQIYTVKNKHGKIRAGVGMH